MIMSLYIPIRSAYFVIDLCSIPHPAEAPSLDNYANDASLRLLDQAVAYRRLRFVSHVTCATHDQRVR